MNDEVKAHGYGYIDGARLAAMIKLVHEPLGLKRQVAADELYTLDFLK